MLGKPVTARRGEVLVGYVRVGRRSVPALVRCERSALASGVDALSVALRAPGQRPRRCGRTSMFSQRRPAPSGHEPMLRAAVETDQEHLASHRAVEWSTVAQESSVASRLWCPADAVALSCQNSSTTAQEYGVDAEATSASSKPGGPSTPSASQTSHDTPHVLQIVRRSSRCAQAREASRRSAPAKASDSGSRARPQRTHRAARICGARSSPAPVVRSRPVACAHAVLLLRFWWRATRMSWSGSTGPWPRRSEMTWL